MQRRYNYRRSLIRNECMFQGRRMVSNPLFALCLSAPQMITSPNIFILSYIKCFTGQLSTYRYHVTIFPTADKKYAKCVQKRKHTRKRHRTHTIAEYMPMDCVSDQHLLSHVDAYTPAMAQRIRYLVSTATREPEMEKKKQKLKIERESLFGSHGCDIHSVAVWHCGTTFMRCRSKRKTDKYLDYLVLLMECVYKPSHIRMMLEVLWFRYHRRALNRYNLWYVYRAHQQRIFFFRRNTFLSSWIT